MKIESPPLSRRSAKHPWRWAWMLSVTLHGIGIVFLLVSLVLSPVGRKTVSSSIELEGRWGIRTDSEERWSETMVSSRIVQSIEDGFRRTAAENEDQLSRMSKRLSETSNRENVDSMAQFLSGLSAPRHRSVPSKSAARIFDVNTAQIDRVRKEIDSKGQEYYIATLVDAQGMTTESELEPELGEQLYKTMKIIESNPLLQDVYRKIVMGFLDQVLSKPTTE